MEMETKKNLETHSSTETYRYNKCAHKLFNNNSSNNNNNNNND